MRRHPNDMVEITCEYFFCPSASRRAGVMGRVERYCQCFAVGTIFDGDGPHVMLRFGSDAFRHGLVKNFGTTAIAVNKLE